MIPLSARDNTSSGEGPTEPAERPGTFDHNGAATKVVDEAVDKLFAHEDVPQEKDLDKLLSKGVDKWQSAKDDAEAWEKSKPVLADLDAQYASQGGDIAKTLELFCDIADQLKANPRETAQNLARSYLKASRYGIKTAKPAPKAEEYTDGNGNRNSGKFLSDKIYEAIDGATADREMFEKSAKTRERLKALWPDLSFDQAVSRIRDVDKRMHQDPLSGAAELGAAFGMPILPQDLEQESQYHAERHAAAAQVAHAAQVLPGFEQLRVPMAHIIESGQANNLQDAYHIAVYQNQEQTKGHHWTMNQLQQIEKTNPALAKSIVDTMFKDAEFVKYAGNADPVNKFEAAITWTKARMGSTKRSVDKAKRAMPVKSSSGAIPSGAGGKGIDAHLNAALSGWRD